MLVPPLPTRSIVLPADLRFGAAAAAPLVVDPGAVFNGPVFVNPFAADVF
jgi:hypothetical protein